MSKRSSQSQLSLVLKTHFETTERHPTDFFTDNRTKGIDLFFLFCLFVCLFVFTLSLICKLGWPFCTKLYDHKTLVFLIQNVILINIPLFQSYNNVFPRGEVPWPEAVPDFSVIITWIWTCFSKSAHSIGEKARWIFTSLRRNLNNQTSRVIWRYLDANWPLRKMP